MQIIKYSRGRFEMKDFVTRKMNREYLDILNTSANIGADGTQKLSFKGVDEASEYLVKAMTERVIEISDEGVEKEVAISRDWLDNLSEVDYIDVQQYVIGKMNEAKDKLKK